MGVKKKTFDVTIEASGVYETLKAFNRLPKSASDSLRARSMELAEQLAGTVRSAGMREGRQARIVATTVKARRDRLPQIQAGGTKRVGSTRPVAAYKVLLGSEFGGNRRTGWYARPRFAHSVGRQFRPHLGRGSYWFYETVYSQQHAIFAKWLQAADDIERDFLADPGV